MLGMLDSDWSQEQTGADQLSRLNNIGCFHTGFCPAIHIKAAEQVSELMWTYKENHIHECWCLSVVLKVVTFPSLFLSHWSSPLHIFSLREKNTWTFYLLKVSFKSWQESVYLCMGSTWWILDGNWQCWAVTHCANNISFSHNKQSLEFPVII